MTFHRLLDCSEDEFEHALLRSARLDLPSDTQVAKGLVAVAVGCASVTSSVSALAGSGAAAAQGLAHSTSGHVGLGALLVKWSGVGLVAGLATVGTGTYVAESVRERPVKEARELQAPATTGPRLKSTTPVVEIGSPASTAEARPPGPVGALTLPPQAVNDDPSPRARTPTAPGGGVTAPGAASVATLPSTRAALRDELDALARARRALSARDPVTSLSEVERYERLAQTHVLDAEAAIIRLEALVQAGRTREAAELARSHLAIRPDSPHRARLQEIIGLASP